MCLRVRDPGPVCQDARGEAQLEEVELKFKSRLTRVPTPHTPALLGQMPIQGLKGPKARRL